MVDKFSGTMKAGQPKDEGAKAAPPQGGAPAIGVLPADADLSNVVVLRRRHSPNARQSPEVAVRPEDRLAPQSAGPARRRNLALFVGCSLALHAVLVAAFNRDPTPLANLGEISISVDVVLGADTAAGLAQSPSESEAADAASSAQQETQPPTAEVTAAAPQTSPEADDIAADPKPAEKPAVSMVTERPRVTEQRKPAPAAKRGERDTRARSASLPSAASSGVGRGRSDAETNYRGLVAAHLARHKQFPADARGRGEQGSALVMFSLDGGGAVTSVKLMRGSGIASFDQETQAMVRRASPFPAPPSGRPMMFTVPVRFHLQ